MSEHRGQSAMADEIAQLKIWRDELLEIGVVSWVLSEKNKNNPRRLIADIVHQQVQETLNSVVSVLHLARIDVAASAAASHFTDGFIIGEDGLPAAPPRHETEADRRLQAVDAALAELVALQDAPEETPY